jgi:vitamin B12 transporter
VIYQTSNCRNVLTPAAVAAALMLGTATGSFAQLATSPSPLPSTPTTAAPVVMVPEVVVSAPANPPAAQAPNRAPKAPAAAQQDSTPRAAKVVKQVEEPEPAPKPRKAQQSTAARKAAPEAAPQVKIEPVLVEPSAVSVAPTGTTTPVDQVGSSVTVITSQEIEAQQRRSANDVLKSVPGVNVVQGGGPGALTSVFIRGTNSNHSKALIDGIDVSDPSGVNRSFNFGHLTTFDIDRVEVLRGPQSGLYGADAIGGVVVAYTKKGDGPLKVDALAEAGSFGTFNQAVSARGSVERFNYAFNVGHFRADNVPVTPTEILLTGTKALNSAYDNMTYSTKLGVDVTRDVTLNFVARYSQTAFGFQGDSFSFADFTNRPDATKSTQDTQQFYTRGEAVWSLYGGRVKTYVGINYTDLTTEDFSPSNGASVAQGQRTKYDWRSVVEVTRGLVVTAGADHQTEKLQVTDLAAEESNTGVYVQAQVDPVRNLFLVGNVRHDENETFGGATTWRFAPAYLIEPTGTKLKGSVGTAFKAPSLSQKFQDFPAFGFFANPNLKPEESLGYDIGFEQALFGNRAQFGATYFRNDVTNLINGTFDQVTFLSSVANIGKATTTGVETFASADVTDDVRVRGDYTYLEAFDEITGKELLRRPRRKATLSVGWKPSTPLLLTGSVTYVGGALDVDRTSFATVALPSYTLVNIAADYKLNSNMSVFGRIDNLFDKHYQNPNGFEGTGIGAYAGLKFNN